MFLGTNCTVCTGVKAGNLRNEVSKCLAGTGKWEEERIPNWGSSKHGAWQGGLEKVGNVDRRLCSFKATSQSATCGMLVSGWHLVDICEHDDGRASQDVRTSES